MNSNAIIPLFIELLIKSMAIVVGAFLLNAALPRISAAKRHYLWLGAFVALLLLPLTKLVRPMWPIELNKPRPLAIVEPRPIPGLESITIPFTAPAPAPMAPMPSRARSADWQRVVITLWIAGAALMLVYPLLGRLRLAWLERRSVANNDARLDALLSAAMEEASIRRAITLRVADEARVPITWGFLCPVVLLPSDCSNWDDPRLLAVLRHEVAHIARNDYLARQFTQWVAALYWPNPLVWLAASALRSSQEQACDDRVLQQGTPPTDYATLLFESVRAMAKRDRVTQHALAMARPSTLEKRVVAIVDDTRDRRPGGMPAFFGAMLFAAAALTLSAIAQVASEEPSPLADAAKEPADFPPVTESPDATIRRKADAIIISSLVLKEASLRECLDLLRKTSIELDPEKKGVNFVLKVPENSSAAMTPITLSLRNVPLSEAAKYVANLANMRCRFEDHAIAIVAYKFDGLGQKEYRLPDNFLGSELRLSQNPGTFEPKRFDMATYLKSKGVTFPEGASAVYIHASRRLIVRNTEENLDLIDSLVGAMTKTSRSEPPLARQAKLETIIIPRLELRGTALKESIEFLSKRIKDLDPEKTGVAMEIATNADAERRRITISLSNIPAYEALKYITSLAGAKFSIVGENRVVIEPLNGAGLITKLYRVSSNSISTKEGTVKGPDGKTYTSVYEFFSAFGVSFPEGASAGLPVSGERIVMRNTQENLDVADAIMAAMAEADGGELSKERLELLREAVNDMKAR